MHTVEIPGRFWTLSLECMKSRIFPGFVFDIYGARESSVFGALVAALAIAGLGFAALLDAHDFPLLQAALVYVCFAVADLGALNLPADLSRKVREFQQMKRTNRQI